MSRKGAPRSTTRLWIETVNCNQAKVKACASSSGTGMFL